MDVIYRQLQRQFFNTRDYEILRKLLQLEYKMGQASLRILADKYEVSYPKAWDCARGYPVGYTQSLINTLNKYLIFLGFNAIDIITHIYEMPDFSDFTHEYRRSNLADTNYFVYKTDVVFFRSEYLLLEDEPALHPYPMLTITDLSPRHFFTVATASIYVRNPEEITRVFDALSSIVANTLVRGVETVADANLLSVNYYTIDQAEAILRDYLGVQ